MAERFVFSLSILKRAQGIADKRQYGGLSEFAREIGCDASSLRVSLNNFRTGKLKMAVEKRRKERAFIEERILAGDTPKEIRKHFATTFNRALKPSALSERMKYMGYDPEVRAELGHEIPMP